MSITIFITLILGIGAGYFAPENINFIMEKVSSIMLFILIFSVGIDMGLNKEVFGKIKKMGIKILLIPLGVVIGTLLGGAVVSFLIKEPLKESLAICSGMGWYSLSGILLTEAGNPVGGTISFLSNVFRELITFTTVPLIARYLNYYCAVAPAGATAMDTTLALISRNTNGKIAVVAFISGISLTLIVPVLVPLFL